MAVTEKNFQVSLNGWPDRKSAKIRILDDGHQEGDNYVYKIEIVEDPEGIFTELIRRNRT